MAPDPDTCSAPFRVRFDEAGPDGRLRTSVLLRYAQDVSWLHSTTRGFDRGWYAERGLTWLVRTAEVAVLAPIVVGEELVGTGGTLRNLAKIDQRADKGYSWQVYTCMTIGATRLQAGKVIRVLCDDQI